MLGKKSWNKFNYNAKNNKFIINKRLMKRKKLKVNKMCLCIIFFFKE